MLCLSLDSMCLTINLETSLHVWLTLGGSLDTPMLCMALSAMVPPQYSLEVQQPTLILVSITEVRAHEQLKYHSPSRTLLENGCQVESESVLHSCFCHQTSNESWEPRCHEVRLFVTKDYWIRYSWDQYCVCICTYPCINLKCISYL